MSASPRWAICRRYASAVMQKPPGVGSPACARRAKFAAFGPTRSELAAAGAERGKMNIGRVVIINPVSRTRCNAKRCTADPGSLQTRRVERSRVCSAPLRFATCCAAPGKRRFSSLHMIAVARQRIDDGDLFDREVGHDLDVLLMHDQHFLDAHAVAVFLAVLRLESKCHAFLDVDRMIERPDARDHGRIVLGETEPVAPEVGGGL